MHQGDMTIASHPRYLRATVGAGFAASLVPIACAAVSIYSISAGPPISGPEVQGGAILAAHFVVAVFFVLTAYPGLAWLLHRRGLLTRPRFYKWLFVSLIPVSVLPTALLASVGFGAEAFVLVPASFALIALLALPFRGLWLRLAQ